MSAILEAIDQNRTRVSTSVLRQRKSDLGQFLTPMNIAEFMASMLPFVDGKPVKLLDPGAGIGSLSAAVLGQLEENGHKGTCVVKAYELDDALHEGLNATLSNFGFSDSEIFGGDFIEHASMELELAGGTFTHSIINPPYKKIGVNSQYRELLRGAGIETVNLYSGFVALALALLEPKGHLVAIIPRSFCNGPYYRPFRNYILENSAIHKIHIFESRSKAFTDDDVLQENIIIHLEKTGKQGDVEISSSSDAFFDDLSTNVLPFKKVVPDGNHQNFFHIPLTGDIDESALPHKAIHSLDELGIQVSTGPVVDFRLKEFLHKMPTSNSVPLLYPAHFEGCETVWPKPETKKHNAISLNENTQKWLYPNGHYAVVRRFSSKEEKRRINAGVFQPDKVNGADFVGFENHLNVFHQKKNGLDPDVASGLTVYLNSTAVDRYFRCFNGHTQVNVTDLKHLKYPSLEALKKLGKWQQRSSGVCQETIDQKINKILCLSTKTYPTQPRY